MPRAATERDFVDLVDLARAFVKETGLRLTFNEVRARETLWAAIHSPAVDFLVEEVDGVLAGVAMITYENAYYDEVCAYVEKLFVHREFRGLGAADLLVNGALDTCRGRRAKIVFASATAGMGERVEKLYVRLFERHGFSVLGRIIARTL